MIESFLLLSCENRLYVVPTLQIREICRTQDLVFYPTPSAPGYMLGMMQLRGEIIPAISLEHIISGNPVLQSPKGIDSRNQKGRVLIFESHIGPIGILVDSIHSYKSLETENFLSPPPLYSDQRDYVKGLVFDGENSYASIDLNLLFGKL